MLAFSGYNSAMIDAEFVRADAHFQASMNYSISTYDIEGTYLKDQFATSKTLSLALLDAAIAEIDAVADAEAEYARKIANELAIFLAENETANRADVNIKRSEISVEAQSEKDAKISRAAGVKIIAEGKAHLVALVSSGADYAKYFLSYVGVEVVYLSSTIAAEVTNFGATAAAYKQLSDNLIAAEDTFDAEYCRLTSRYQEALSIVHTGGTVDAEFYENGASSLYVEVCFPAGFEVDLTDGTTKKIEDFEGGEEVWAKDHRNPNGPLLKCKVVRAFKNAPKETIKITFDNGLELQATPEHPFWVPEKGWVSCESLAIGDICVNKEGIATKFVSKELVAEKVPVYNIEVEDGRTYFIGKDGQSLLVHNECLDLTVIHETTKENAKGIVNQGFRPGQNGLRWFASPESAGEGVSP